MERTRVKLVVVGDRDVGKTCQLISYTTSSFPSAYLPDVFENYTADVMLDGKRINLDLWDTADPEPYCTRLPSLVASHVEFLSSTARFFPPYVGTNVFLVCFSIVSRVSFDSVRTTWLPEIRLYCPRAPFVLVGLKEDLRSDPDTVRRLAEKKVTPVSQEEGERLAKELRAYAYCENSAVTVKGLKHTFETGMRCALGSMPPQPEPVKPPTPPRPLVTVPLSSLADDVRRALEAGLVADWRVASASGGREMLVQSVVVRCVSEALWSKEGQAMLFSSVVTGNEGVTVLTVREEHSDALFTLLEMIYGVKREGDTRAVSRLAAAMEVKEEQVLSAWPVWSEAMGQYHAKLLKREDASRSHAAGRGKASALALTKPMLLSPIVVANMRQCADAPQSLTSEQGFSALLPVRDRDICFRCEDNDEVLWAHRAVLAMRCERFRALFSSGMADAKKKELEVRGHNRTTMGLVVGYLYTDALAKCPDARLVLAAADEYGIERLGMLAAAQLESKLREETVVNTLEAAVTHNCSALAEVCLQTMRMSWATYSKRNDVKDWLSSAQWAELEQSQYPPLSYLAAVQKWKAEGAEWEKSHDQIAQQSDAGCVIG